MLAAARLEAELTIHHNGSIDVARLRMEHGQWRLDLDSDGARTGDAFRTVPLAGRQACLDPHAARPAGKSGGGGGALDLRRVEMDDVTAELDFDTWAMALSGASAVGSLHAGGDGPVLLFEAHDVAARAGWVRIGGPRSPWRTRVPLDGGAITRVGVFPDAPTDLTLEVAGGTTGKSLLSGRARFLNIFPPPGRAPAPGAARPGCRRPLDALRGRAGAAGGGLEAGRRLAAPHRRRPARAGEGPFHPAGRRPRAGGRRHRGDGPVGGRAGRICA